MEVVTALMERPALSINVRASAENCLACWAFSAFLPVMEENSSMDAEVSSSPAACSEAPCARDWLADDICSDAEATWPALSERLSTIRFTGRITNLEIKEARIPITIKQATAPVR